MYYSIQPFSDITWHFGMTTQELQEYEDQQFAKGVAAQAAINAGKAPAVNAKGAIDPQQAFLAEQVLTKAQASALNVLSPAQAQVYRATAGTLIPAQAAVLQSQVPINTEVAKAQAADTYQQVQGGGIAAQSYTALPWVLGGALVLTLVGWILYANKRKK